MVVVIKKGSMKRVIILLFMIFDCCEILDFYAALHTRHQV